MKSSGVRRTFSDGMKYSAVKSSEGSENSNLSEKSPLLENVEKLSISMPVEGEQTSVRRPVTQPEVRSCNEHITSNPGKKVNNSATKDGNGVQLINSDNKTSESKGGIRECQGARPKVPVSLNTSSRCSSGTNETSRENNIDIVRKMSHPDVDGNSQWKVIGPYQKLKLKSCQRLYASTGRADDLALFFHNGRFYIMEAWCTHMGGPLFEGDIEDYNGRCHVMCPWHSYMFDLETGKNEIGLQQTVHELKLEDGQIFVKYHSNLTTEPVRKPSEPSGPRVIQRPPEGKHEKMRKQSVLDTPLKLA